MITAEMTKEQIRFTAQRQREIRDQMVMNWYETVSQRNKNKKAVISFLAWTFEIEPKAIKEIIKKYSKRQTEDKQKI